MRLTALAALCVALIGCSPTTVITLEDGKQITYKGGRGERATLKRGGVELEIDRRGRPGLIEQIAALWGASGIKKEAD